MRRHPILHATALVYNSIKVSGDSVRSLLFVPVVRTASRARAHSDPQLSPPAKTRPEEGEEWTREVKRGHSVRRRAKGRGDEVEKFVIKSRAYFQSAME
jgi:hypothetical protein